MNPDEHKRISVTGSSRTVLGPGCHFDLDHRQAVGIGS